MGAQKEKKAHIFCKFECLLTQKSTNQSSQPLLILQD